LTSSGLLWKVDSPYAGFCGDRWQDTGGGGDRRVRRQGEGQQEGCSEAHVLCVCGWISRTGATLMASQLSTVCNKSGKPAALGGALGRPCKEVPYTYTGRKQLHRHVHARCRALT
jgi:hypothetical protein